MEAGAKPTAISSVGETVRGTSPSLSGEVDKDVDGAFAFDSFEIREGATTGRSSVKGKMLRTGGGMEAGAKPVAISANC